MKREEKVPVNRVRALDLEAELQAEYGKQAWKDAEAAAWLRWTVGGGKVQRVTSAPSTRRRGGYYA